MPLDGFPFASFRDLSTERSEMYKRKNTLVNTNHEQFPEANELSFDIAVSLFIRDCKVRNLSPHTITYYQNELKMVQRYLESEGIKDVAQVTENDIKEHVIERMFDEEKKDTAINTRLRAARAFFRFLRKKNHIPVNPTEDLSLIKEKRNVIETFTNEQIRMLLRVPDRNTFTGLRDYTLMIVMLETGVRLKELVGIRVQHVNLADGYIRITEAKGYKERNVPIQRQARQVLRHYIAVRGHSETDFLFVTLNDEPIAYRSVQKRIAKIGKLSGVKNVRVSAHTFRHTFAKLSVQNGANIFELQAILGHTSLEMVRRYVNLFSKDVARGHAKFSPVENLH
jgi:integrase/recombinase XerD